jgi:dipeptidyl aminopeptidase/acylaminoacyl peptidase
VKIDSFGAKHGFWIASQVHPAFSPDARHLVAANPRNLVIIGVDDGKARPLTRPGEFVTGFAWLGSEEIGYVAHSNRRGKYQEITDRTFWRQRIHEPLEARREVFRQIGFDGCPKDGIGSLDWPLEHWSPCGRYTVFMSQRNDGQFQLLDVNSGNVRAFGRSGVDSEGISWKPDGSAVIIVNRKRSESFQALLLHPTTGEIVDLSEQFNESFGKGSQHSAPKLAPLWTPDGQYLLANHLEVGGCVVRPSPWEVIPVGRQVLEHVRRTDARTLFPSASDRLPWAFRQPAAPWVRVWVQFEVEGRPHGEDYAVNYETGAIVPLGASDSPGGGWTITPDAKRAARFDRWDILVIRPVNLPHGAGG